MHHSVTKHVKMCIKGTAWFHANTGNVDILRNLINDQSQISVLTKAKQFETMKKFQNFINGQKCSLSQSLFHTILHNTWYLAQGTVFAQKFFF